MTLWLTLGARATPPSPKHGSCGSKVSKWGTLLSCEGITRFCIMDGLQKSESTSLNVHWNILICSNQPLSTANSSSFFIVFIPSKSRSSVSGRISPILHPLFIRTFSDFWAPPRATFSQSMLFKMYFSVCLASLWRLGTSFVHPYARFTPGSHRFWHPLVVSETTMPHVCFGWHVMRIVILLTTPGDFHNMRHCYFSY